ncbi:MAG: family 78 glycoside hydrolase catalytic domain [Massilibacteroides sp.]|nr:family 78 glycoside hydrolase catalytic domain [Massilibacteroides sp.]
MKQQKFHINNNIFIFFLYSFFSCSCQMQIPVTVDELQCCQLTNPEGIDIPLLSWKIKTLEEDVYQTAWEIEIATNQNLLKNGKADFWKSGKRLSDSQFNIQPDCTFEESIGYYWRVRIWDNTDKVSSWSDPAYFSIGLLNESSWSSQWVTYPYDKEQPLPYFRKEFNIDNEKIPSKAIAYFCGLGAGELYINGQQIEATRLLDPAQTNYEQYALYSTFDVSDFLTKGNNCIGVMLGNGWFTQDRAWLGAPFSYGNPMFRFQLIMQFNDGSRRVLNSDESWFWKEGPVCKTNIYLGENYDARREDADWAKAKVPSTDWKSVLIASKDTPPRLLPQKIHPIRKKEILTAKDLWQDPSGNWVYDYGVNVAGIPLLEVEQPAGTQITIRFAEEIDASKKLDFNTTGWTHHGDIFKDEYICKGGIKEKWSPKFTYHGYRYAELSGFSGKPDLNTLKLIIVHSDVENTGYFECADKQINQLHELAVRTVKSNLHGIPTDCPIREKCGWLGDVHAYAKMANMNFQMDNFWNKYLEDIRSGAAIEEKSTLFHERYNSTFYFTEKASGIPYMIAPGKRLCGVASPDWGTVLVQLPWLMYVYYGDKHVLEEYYPIMKQWVEYIASIGLNKERTKKYNSKTTSIIYQGLGDWCPPAYKTNETTPVEFTSTAFHYLDTDIMEQVARLLGKNEDEKSFYSMKNEIAKEIFTEMYDSKNKTFGSQTADAMALDFGLIPTEDERAVSDAIVRNMNETSEGFTDCGIFGLCRIGSMLARHGNVEAAWNLFTKKGENSFEWMFSSVRATSLWESLPINQLSQEMAKEASHNHPMQSGYDIFFFEDIAGIRPEANGFGFKVIRFQPLFCDYLPWAKAKVQSPYGEIMSNWKKDENSFEWEISIPANSSGLVFLPFDKKFTVNNLQLDTNTMQKVERCGNTIGYKFPSGHFFIREE